MKRLKFLFALLLFCSLGATAQTYNYVPQYIFTQKLGAGRATALDSSTYFAVGPNTGAVAGILPPRVNDTAAILGVKKNGLLIYSNQLNNYARWDSINAVWATLGGASKTIYNADDSTDDRTVTVMDEKYLIFNAKGALGGGVGFQGFHKNRSQFQTMYSDFSDGGAFSSFTGPSGQKIAGFNYGKNTSDTTAPTVTLRLGEGMYFTDALGYSPYIYPGSLPYYGITDSFLYIRPSDGRLMYGRSAGGGGADSTTASNGLTETANNIKLGGALIENTTLTHGAYSLTHTGDLLIANIVKAGKGRNALQYNTGFGANTLDSITTGNFNTAIGYFALQNTTTGVDNTAVGVTALRFNTTGTTNTALGRGALGSNISGNRNTGNGEYSLFSNTTGSTNTGIGYSAGDGPITGSNNIYLGYYSGRWRGTTATVNTFPTQSIFIGDSTKAAADSQINQIVIGHNAVGNGSNTATLGKGLTATYLKGKINNDSLAGVGDRMVVANAAGDLSTQAIPTGGGSTDTVSYSKDEWHKVIKFLGGDHTTIMPVGAVSPTLYTTMVGLPDNAIRAIPFYIEKQKVITGAYWYIGQNGAYNADQTNGLALYTFDTATAIYTKVAETINDTAFWKRGTGKQSQAFTSTYTAAPGQILWLAPLYNNAVQVTQPQIRAMPSPMLDLLAVQTTRRLWWQINTQNSFAATYTFAAAASAVTNAGLFFELY